jgi:diguanylate cyclase (GGDEF)-like protein/PAS domain S-box-containing protein
MSYEYFYALIIAAIVSTVVAVSAWKRRSAIEAKSVIFLMSSLAVWAFTYAIHWIVRDPSAKSFWLNATYLGVVTSPAAFLLFALQYTNRGILVTKKTVFILSIIPGLTLILLWTDPWHQLFYGGYPPQGTILKGGIGFWINAIYSYLLLLISLILILIEFFRSMKPIRRQVAIILLGMCLPWIGNMICLMGLSPFPEIDLTPFIFILSGGLFIVGITNFRFLDVRPIARSLLVENMKNGVIILNESLIVMDINPSACQILDTSKKIIGKEISSINSDWSAKIGNYHGSALSSFEIRINGERNNDYEVNITHLVDSNNKIFGYILVLYDVTLKKETAEIIARSEKRYRQLFENACESIAVIQDERIVICNPVTSELTGYTNEELQSRPFHDLVLPEDLPVAREHYERIIHGEPIRGKFQIKIMRKDKQIRWVELSDIRIIWEERPASLIFLIDITETIKAVSVLEFQNSHDFLTGLFNRQYYETEIDKLQKNREYPISMVVLDMNGLKEINDTYGHKIGDEYLQLGARLIKSTFQQEKIVARIGGDEFVVVLSHINEFEAEQIAQRIKQNIEEHNNQNPTGKQISFAVGFATGQSPDLPDEIFRKADQVMYLDKENYYKNRSGDRRHRIYSDFTENGTGSENILSSGS